jgi:FlaA1/EpsC-like NDP-sugar epimerase
MTRFMMKISEAVDLVLKAALLSGGEELFILKMPVMRIDDIAKAMIELLAKRFGHADIAMEIVGRREGEKIYELLMTEEEAENVYENGEMFCIAKKPPAGFVPSAIKHYRSDKCKIMSFEKVKEFVRNSMPEIEKS